MMKDVIIHIFTVDWSQYFLILSVVKKMWVNHQDIEDYTGGVLEMVCGSYNYNVRVSMFVCWVLKIIPVVEGIRKTKRD